MYNPFKIFKEVCFVRNQPITAVIVGAGHRAFVYSKLALTDPDKLKLSALPTRTKFDKKGNGNVRFPERELL